jgi:FSR family fosmidomycin resistance protein-like MFS transporter
MHLLTDAVGISFLLYSLKSSGNYLTVIVLYTFLSFGTQPFIGIIADKTKKYRLMIYISVALMVIGTIKINIYFSTVLLGLGNSLFHIAGGGVAIFSRERDSDLGVFVAPGAVGLMLGYNFNHLYIIFEILLFALVIFLILTGFNDKYYINATNHSKENSSSSREFDVMIPMLLIISAVFIRGFSGTMIKPDFINNAWLTIIFASFIALGKAIGGFISDRIGASKSILLMLFPSAFILAFGKDLFVTAFIGILLFNTTMPITLGLLTRILPENKNFAFGLAACMLFIGTYCTYYLSAFTGYLWYLFLTMTIIGAIAIISADKILKKTATKTIPEYLIRR